jgi:hypothetical protein
MLKIFKQELFFIPLMFLLMEALRFGLSIFYPETALFDKGSELETFLFSLWQIVWITSASVLLLRIVFPPAFRTFKDFYLNFDTKGAPEKETYSILFYLVFFFGMIWLVSGRAATPTNELLMRHKLVDTLYTQLEVRELTGHNDGKEVEKYLTYVGRYKGDSWCAAFTSWNLNAIGVTSPPNPKSGWSPNFSIQPYIIWSLDLVKKHRSQPISPGDCFTLYYPSLGRVGHVGFILEENNNYFITIEGNTGLTGSRDGSGVHKYKRSKSKVYRVTNYITPYLKIHEKLNFNYTFNDSSNVVYTKNYRVHGKKFRSYQYKNIGKGLSLIQRLCLSHKTRYSKDTSQCNGRFQWSYKPTRNCNRDSLNEKFCRNKEWQTNIYMRMQRFRTPAEDKRTAYTEALFREFQNTGYKGFAQNGSGTIPPLVGENT